MCKMNGQTKIVDWYKDTYPADEWGINGINKAATFHSAYECLRIGFNFYTFLGEVDSIVRERVFWALSKLMDCDYSYIYNKWLDAPREVFAGRLITNMKGLKF